MVKLMSTVFIILMSSVQIITATPVDLRIVGGRYAKAGEFPYQVSIRRSYTDSHNCGGTIITPKHVLTAAHCCFYNWGGVLPPAVVKVVAGQLTLTSTTSTVSRVASKIIVHQEYNTSTFANDIAIIELANELPFGSDLIGNVPLNNNVFPADTACVISGWGVQEFPSFMLSEKLMATDVLILSHKECQERYNKDNVTLSSGMLCAVNDERATDACQGDSGGPMVCEGRLAGIISTGKGCADKNFPGIYSDVHYFRAWIEENIPLKYLDYLSPISEEELSTEKSIVTEDVSKIVNNLMLFIDKLTSSSCNKKFSFNLYFCMSFVIYCLQIKLY